MKQTVLLTGFAGFIGSQILKDLLYRGYKVVGVDNFSAGSDISNVELPNILNTPLFSDNSDYDFTYIKKNIEKLSKEDVEVLLGDLHCSTLDYVISCAAESHVDRCYKEIDTFISSNINGPINLAKIALEMKVKKFLHVSSDEVWGEAPQPYTEETSIKTGNAYASSKASAELFLHNFYKAFNLPLVITNGANCIHKHEYIPSLIENVFGLRYAEDIYTQFNEGKVVNLLSINNENKTEWKNISNAFESKNTNTMLNVRCGHSGEMLITNNHFIANNLNLNYETVEQSNFFLRAISLPKMKKESLESFDLLKELNCYHNNWSLCFVSDYTYEQIIDDFGEHIYHRYFQVNEYAVKTKDNWRVTLIHFFKQRGGIPISLLNGIEDKIKINGFITDSNGNKIERFLNVKDIVWLFGMYQAEGLCVESNHDVNVQIFSDMEHVHEFIEKSNRLGLGFYYYEGTGFKRKDRTLGMQPTAKVYGKLPLALFKYVFKGKESSVTARLPEWLFKISDDNKKLFLDGHWCGDGIHKWELQKEKHYSCSTASRGLTYDLCWLIKSLGFYPIVSYKRARPYKECPVVYNCWVIRVDADDNRPIRWTKQGIGKRINRTKHDTVNLRILKKTSIEYDDFVYDFEVPDNHNFVLANGAIVHNSYGPNQATEKIIPKTIYNIVSGIKIPLYKTRARRMWLAVSDHSKAVILAMEKGVIGEKYCLAPEPENELYTDDLIRMICEICGVVFEDVVEYVADRPNYDLRYWMLNDKAKQDLGWNPFTKIEEALPCLVTHYTQKFSK